VTQLRDLENDKELSFVAEAERERLRADRRRQAEVQQQQMEDAYTEVKRAAKETRDRRIALRRCAFGKDTLFERNAAQRFAKKAAAPADVVVEAYAGLPGAGSSQAWAKLVRGGCPSLAGFAGASNGSYAEALAHVLLRVPAVALWLDRHVDLCGVGGEKCLACALHRSRRDMGRKAGGAELFRRAVLADVVYADKGREHDVMAFLADVLKAMRAEELAALRSAACADVDLDGQLLVTHVERLFAFFLDVRGKCSACGACWQEFEFAHVLDLRQAACDGAPTPAYVTDLYLRFCAPKQTQRTCSSSTCGKAVRDQVEQRALATLPNVVLVQVAGNVNAEEQISFPDLGHLVLSGVIYRGKNRAGGLRYLCAARGPDGFFWMFDGSRAPWRPGHEIGRALPSGVVLLVYMRPGGKSVFAGVAAAVSAPTGVECRRRLLRKTSSAEARLQVGLDNRPSAETQGTPPRVRRLLAASLGTAAATPVSNDQKDTAREGLLSHRGAERANTPTRRLRGKTDSALLADEVRGGQASDDEAERPLAVIFAQYPRLRADPVALSSIESWRQDPERARVYAENAERAGWPGVKAGADSSGAGLIGFRKTVIGQALIAGASDGSGGGVPLNVAVPVGSPSKRRIAGKTAEERLVGKTFVAGAVGGNVNRGDAAGSSSGAQLPASLLFREATTPERHAKVARSSAGLPEQEQDAEPCASAQQASGHLKRRSTAAGRVAVALKAAAQAKAKSASSRGKSPEIVASSAGAASSDLGGGDMVANSGSIGGGVAFPSGKTPAVDGALLAWRLPCFRSLACSLQPSSCDVRLLEAPQIDVCERVYGLSRERLLESQWRCLGKPTGGVRNLGNTCFVNAVLQVLAHVEPFVKLVAAHRHQRVACFMCKVKEQVEQMRAGVLVTRSPVALAARAGGCTLPEADFDGDPVSGGGPQCDAWKFCRAVVHELATWEKEAGRKLFASESAAARAHIAERSVLDEFVWGPLYRTRIRCAKCSSASDSLLLRDSVDLNLPVGRRSLQELYEYHVGETRGAGTRCPQFEARRSDCDGCGYMQQFLEREPPVLFFTLLRFDFRRSGRFRVDGTEEFDEVRLNTAITFPEQIRFLRSGPYQFAAAVLHHGTSTRRGHYTALCWEGRSGVENVYRWYNDDAFGRAMPWREAWCKSYGELSLGSAVYFLVYVRTAFWGNAVGDGSERVPYRRDEGSVNVAESLFRQEPVLLEGGGAAGHAQSSASGGGGASGSSARVRGEEASRSSGMVDVRDDGVAAGASAGSSSGHAGCDGEAAWRQFTPAVIEASLCQARTWANGKGAQCKRKPQSGELLCGGHLRELRAGTLKHGWVTGSIPDGALRDFENEQRKVTGTAEKESAESSSAVIVPSKRSLGGDGNIDEEECKSGFAKRRSKKEAAKFFDMEADADSCSSSGDCADDSDGIAEMAGWLTEGEGSGEHSDEEGLHRRVDVLREQSASRVQCATEGHEQGERMRPVRRLVRGTLTESAAGSSEMQSSCLAGGPRVVSGFGEERVADVYAQRQQRDAAGLRRASSRREEGTRGRMTGFDGQDLDRSRGGAWHAGRR